MKSPEKPEIPVEICPTCYNPKSAHAADCDYEEKVARHSKSEGITPEFEADVKSGKITFEKQMNELKNFWESIKNSPSVPTNREKDPRIIVAESLVRYGDSIEKLKSFESDLIFQALENSEELASLLRQIGKLDTSIKLCILKLNESQSTEYVDELERLTTEFNSLASEFVEKLKSLNQ